MSNTNDGGPAFPRVGEGFNNPSYSTPGMSLRDYFAGQALAGMLPCTANEDVCETISESGQTPQDFMAGAAYLYADAMIAEREGGRG